MIVATRPSKIEAEAACSEFRVLLQALEVDDVYGVYYQPSRSAVTQEWCYAIHVAKKP